MVPVTSDGSPCCGRLNITAEPHHGAWMIHFNKLGSFTMTNTLVRGRNTWINDEDPEFLISWCGQFWHIGHRGEAGQCNGYLSSPDDTVCFQAADNFRSASQRLILHLQNLISMIKKKLTI